MQVLLSITGTLTIDEKVIRPFGKHLGQLWTFSRLGLRKRVVLKKVGIPWAGCPGWDGTRSSPHTGKPITTSNFPEKLWEKREERIAALCFDLSIGKSRCVMKRSHGSAVRPAQATISAHRFLYKLCGSSQPSMIRGSDGGFYVVKFFGYPGRQGLINEVVGAELLQKMRLPSPSGS